MFHKKLAVVMPMALELAGKRIRKGLGACLMLILLTHLPAHADHVHHLWYSNSNWQDQDLTSLTGGGLATPFGAIAAFRTTPNNQLHVYYVDSNAQHVHQLYYNGSSWSDDDLTSFTGGPQAYAYGITGFAIGNLQYVFYVGFDNHVHQTYYNNSNWQDQDLTALVGGIPRARLLLWLLRPSPTISFMFIIRI